MKHLSCLGALVIFTLSPAFAFADGPPPGPLPVAPVAPVAPHGTLAYAAHELTGAAQALSHILGDRGPSDHVFQDAQTLYDAAEHFEEEVVLGPEDLDVDFQAIEATFDEMRDELRAAPCIHQNPAARSAWFQISEANLRLRIAWFTHWFTHLAPRTTPARPPYPPHDPRPLPS